MLWSDSGTDRFMRNLCEDAALITADEIAALLEGGWRGRRTAAWLYVSRRSEFRERLGELLPASEVCCAGLAHSVALAGSRVWRIRSGWWRC
ncbi:DUF6000 family protein [Streptomyces geysiriensis]|uniref:DUF6000 family protein n=1 Tax=Streptomyces geysiriensis TaxID=68207 RepID=UPI0035ABBCE6